jgi:hypothetical protein
MSRIFISYSHRGNGLVWKNGLLSQLAVFEKHHVLDVWHDDETKLGDDWHARINAASRNRVSSSTGASHSRLVQTT